MRFEPSMTSSSSEEIRITARPSIASSSIKPWISALAPTSIPLVGSSSSTTLGVVAEKSGEKDLLLVAPGKLVDALIEIRHLDLKPIDVFADQCLHLGGRHEAPSGDGPAAAKVMLSLTDMVGTIPSAFLSSGSRPTPCATCRCGRTLLENRLLHSDLTVVEAHQSEDALNRLTSA